MSWSSQEVIILAWSSKLKKDEKTDLQSDLQPNAAQILRSLQMCLYVFSDVFCYQHCLQVEKKTDYPILCAFVHFLLLAVVLTERGIKHSFFFVLYQSLKF